MTKLTPARKALLQKLVDNGGSIGWSKLMPSESTVGTAAEKAGLTAWERINVVGKKLVITDAGRDALQNEGK